MKKYEKPDISDEEFLETMFNAAREYFCDGIFIATSNHECGWDFLNFSYMDKWEDLIYSTVGDGIEINNSNYSYCDEEGKTVLEILNQNGWKFEFEKCSIEW